MNSFFRWSRPGAALAVLGALAACDSDADLTGPATSALDGRPLVQLSERDFLEDHAHVRDVRARLGAHGEAVVAALNAVGKTGSDAPFLPLHSLALGAGKTGGETADLASRVVTTDERGRRQGYLLGLERLTPRNAAAGKGAAALDAGTSYLILDPDFFYVHEDAQGNETYPFDVPAVALDGSGAEATVTFVRQGEVELKAAGKAMDGDPGIVVIEALPYCEANPDDPECSDEGGGGGGDDGDSDTGGGSVSPEEPSFDTGVSPTNVYLSVSLLRLDDNGENGGAELQLYTEPGDDYSLKFSRNRDYDFDTRFIFWHYEFGNQYSTVNRSAYVKNGRRDEWVRVRDVDNVNTDYSFTNMARWYYSNQGTCYNRDGTFFAPCTGYFQSPTNVDYFPILALGTSVHRLLFAENDHDYDRFSKRHGTEWSGNVETFNMLTKAWETVFTKVNAEYLFSGSSDDVIPRSGIRQINLDNAYNVNPYGAIQLERQGFKHHLVRQYIP